MRSSNNHNRPVAFRFTTDLWQQMAEQAERGGLTPSEYVRRAVGHEVANRGGHSSHPLRAGRG